MEKSVIMQIPCEDEECGMVSAYRVFSDGSFSRVLEACCHLKKLPGRETIRKEIKLHERSDRLSV